MIWDRFCWIYSTEGDWMVFQLKTSATNNSGTRRMSVQSSRWTYVMYHSIHCCYRGVQMLFQGVPPNMLFLKNGISLLLYVSAIVQCSNTVI